MYFQYVPTPKTTTVIPYSNFLNISTKDQKLLSPKMVKPSDDHVLLNNECHQQQGHHWSLSRPHNYLLLDTFNLYPHFRHRHDLHEPRALTWKQGNLLGRPRGLQEYHWGLPTHHPWTNDGFCLLVHGWQKAAHDPSPSHGHDHEVSWCQRRW